MGNEKDELNGEKVKDNILANYKSLEKSIVAQLNMLQDVHGTTIGSLRETIWQELFERIIPKKFVIEQSVFIIDSNKNVSKEVDLVIMDEMYTPYIFRFGKIKYVPIEAVAVVVECKSKNQRIKGLIEWSDAIKKLKTCPESITRIATQISFDSPKTQKATRPIQILCRLNGGSKEEIFEHFDIIISATKDKIKVDYKKEKLFDWFIALNFHETLGYEQVFMRPVDHRMEKLCQWYEECNGHPIMNEANKSDNSQSVNGKGGKKKKETDEEKLKNLELSDYQIPDNPLLSLNFQLNQLLMLINNPMPFPHLAYAEMFSGKKKKGEPDE